MKNLTTFFLCLVFTIFFACGGGDDDDEQKPTVNIQEHACFQKTSSPDYPKGVDNYIEMSAPNQLNNTETQIIAETYDCLLDQNLITIKEYNCLLDDIDNLQIVLGQGMYPGGNLTCEGKPGVACIRDNTFVMLVTSNDDSLRHETCHRAAHLTIGERGHNFGWWIEFPPPSTRIDCVCELGI